MSDLPPGESGGITDLVAASRGNDFVEDDDCGVRLVGSID